MAEDTGHYATHSQDFNIVVDHYGDAEGTAKQFADSNPDSLNGLLTALQDTFNFIEEQLSPRLLKIGQNLADCWQGDNANKAIDILNQLLADCDSAGGSSTESKSLSYSMSSTYAGISTLQAGWRQCKADAANLKTGFSVTDAAIKGDFSGGNDQGAKNIYDAFTRTENDAMHQMPNTLVWHNPLGDRDHSPGPPKPSGPPGPGHIPPGPGHIPPGPGHIPPGTPGPPGPGHIPGTGIDGGGGLPGTGIDTSGGLAGIGDGGGIGGGGGGLGGGLGGGSGLGGGVGSGGAGAGAGGGGLGAAGAGSGLGAGGAGAGAGAAGARGAGMMPMHPSGGNDEQERERSTWLTEEDDVWGDDDDLPPKLQ